MKATLLLRREHRNIEQALVLLHSMFDLTASDFHRLAGHVLRHLAAEESLLYPAAEKRLMHDLAMHRARSARVRAAVLDAMHRTDDAAAFRAGIRVLSDAFAAHARLEERAVHASLECAMSEAALETLGVELATFRPNLVALPGASPDPATRLVSSG